MSGGKIDVNGYYGNWPYWQLRHGSEDEILRLMDGHGIERLALASTRAIFSDWEEGNEEVRRLVRRHPDRFLAIVTVNPILGESQLTRFKAYLDDEAIIGFRLYPIYHDYELTAQEGVLEELLSWAEAADMPVFIPIRLMMNWSMPVLPMSRVAPLLVRFPRLRIVLGGVNYGELKRARPLLLQHQRVFIETSCLQLRGAIEQLAALIGVERLLFGTGMPLQNPACEIAKIENLELPDDQRNMILRMNALKLMERKR